MDCQSHSSNMMVLLLLASSLAYFLYNKKVLPGMSMKPIILFFAARQKDHARSSVSELLLALKDPRSSLSESRNNTLKRKSQESGDVLSGEVPGKRISESGSRRNSRSGMRNSLQKISEVPEGGNKTRKSGLRSFMGYDNKPHDIIIAFALFQSFLAESLLSLHLFSHLICLCSLIGMGHKNVEKNCLHQNLKKRNTGTCRFLRLYRSGN